MEIVALRWRPLIGQTSDSYLVRWEAVGRPVEAGVVQLVLVGVEPVAVVEVVVAFDFVASDQE